MAIEPSASDQRRKLVSLTPRGQALIDLSRAEIWPRIAAAVTDLCGGLDGPILDQLSAIEDGLAAAPLIRRAQAKETK